MSYLRQTKGNSNQNEIYEPLSDLSLGVLGIFSILLLVMLMIQQIKKKNHQDLITHNQKLKHEIKELHQQHKDSMIEFNQSMAQNDLFKTITQKKQLTDQWKSVIQSKLKLKQLKGVEDNQNPVDTSGVAHLRYQASADGTFKESEPFILLNQELELSPAMFHEIIQSIRQVKDKPKESLIQFSHEEESNNHDVSFFILSETDIPKWMQEKLLEWDWDFVELERKS